MKTLIFVSPTGTFDNGAEISIFNLMKYLVFKGYRVINLAPGSDFDNKKEYQKKCLDEGIEIHFLPCIKWWWEDAPGGIVGTDVSRATSYRENINSIRHFIWENKADIVITNTVNMFQGAIAAACESIPHFWLIHEFPENEFDYYLDKVDFIQDYSTNIYAVSGKLNDTLNKHFTKMEVKNFSPYTEIVPTKIKKATKHRIVSVGRLTKRKNQLELIKAYEKMQQKDLELVFIGAWDADYKKICSDYIHEHKIKNIRFTGNLDNPWAELTDKDICVFPSAMETFGLVYVEALLNGIPVIFSDNPGHLSAYEIFDFGDLYEQGNIDQLVFLLKDLLNNFEEKKKKAVNFVSIAEERYQIQNVYATIINDLKKPIDYELNSIRHIKNLLSHNERKSKLASLEFKVRLSIQRLKNRFFR
ncbi:glycosyltransferase family 4 protein [Enterococcus sp. 22-H-5-01]|uniref:glycosyltransferase family 4 protein n=1 Tax=Enterococcus sp. 22-H-5-01 TaxID=3418555 RepID=UPI003D05FD2A